MQNFEYELVPIAYEHNDRIHKRDSYAARMNFRAFHQKYTLFLEEKNHVLIGDQTPMFVARLNDQNDGESDIVYDRTEYVRINKLSKKFFVFIAVFFYSLYQRGKSNFTMTVLKEQQLQFTLTVTMYITLLVYFIK